MNERLKMGIKLGLGGRWVNHSFLCTKKMKKMHVFVPKSDKMKKNTHSCKKYLHNQNLICNFAALFMSFMINWQKRA